MHTTGRLGSLSCMIPSLDHPPMASLLQQYNVLITTLLAMYVYVTVLDTVSSNICSLMHPQIKHSLSHLQDLIFTLAGVIACFLVSVKVGIESCSYVLESLFFHVAI